MEDFERIVIPGRATYSPVALTDLILGAPLASRLLLGATLPGQAIATVSMGYYAGSAARDWWFRRGVRPVDFQAEFGADVDTLEPMPVEARVAELKLLGHALNEGYTPEHRPREAVARQVNDRLTAYIATITGQEVVTSSEVRSFNVARMLMPSALGTCDVISGDVAIFQDMGVLEPHIIAHEFCHRKGYLKELYAQALSYLALRTSGDPLLVQSVRVERLHRQLRVLEREHPDGLELSQLIDCAHLRPELREWFGQLSPSAEAHGAFASATRALYDKRMQLTGQNGISDYDEGFTNFLWTFSRSEDAKQPRVHAAI